jgi:serine O-acetyltransferase
VTVKSQTAINPQSIGATRQQQSNAEMTVRDLTRQIHEDWKANFHDWTQPGFRAIAVHRFGTWVHQLRRGVVRALLVRVHRSMFRYVRNHYGIELPVTARIGKRVVIGHQSGIVIHPNAVIGDECLIRQNVTIGAATFERHLDAPTLGRGVLLGCGVVIVGGVTIGDRVTIGPNAVVMVDVPADTSVFVSSPRTFKLTKSQVETGSLPEVAPPDR